MRIIGFDNSQVLSMFKNYNAMRVVTGWVIVPIDGQYVQVIHFR